jgi:hypothetical protein
MKRFIQIVALAVASLLVAQPALANASCAHRICGSDHSAFNCCMHAGDMPTSGMSSNVPMVSTSAGCQTQWHAALTEPQCTIETACLSPARFLPPLIANGKRDMPSVDLLVELVPATVLSVSGSSPRSSGAPVIPVSGKYILFRDLRI